MRYAQIVGDQKAIDLRRLKKYWVSYWHGERVAQVLRCYVDGKHCESVAVYRVVIGEVSFRKQAEVYLLWAKARDREPIKDTSSRSSFE